MASWLVARLWVRTRRMGPHRVAHGGVLLVANHQSFLDPPMIGMAAVRRLSYMARRTLFDNPVFGYIIGLCNTFPIARDRLDVAGIKEAIRRLRRGEAVLMFPEGTRSPDGSIRPFKRGFGMLARRAGVPMQPVLIDGTYKAWPKGRKWPGRGRAVVVFGELIPAETVRDLSNDELGALVFETLTGLKEEFGDS